MKIPKPYRRALAGAILATGISYTALQGATYLWDGGGANDNWTTVANWNPNTAPSTSATDDLIQFSGVTRLTPIQDFSPSLRIQSLQFASGAGAFSVSGLQIKLQTGTAAPTIVQSSASNQTVSAPLNFVDGVTLSGTGAGTLTLGALSGTGALTKTSTGTLDIAGAVSIPGITVSTGTVNFASGSSSSAALIAINAGGNFTLNGGTVDTGAGAFFQVGNSAGAATATLTTGALTSTETDIGNVANATGTMTQNGGTHTVVGQLYLGVSAASTGNYTLNGGTLATTGTRIGHLGTGTFTQTGGAHNVTGALHLGSASGGNGTYNLNGGTLTATTITDNGLGASSTSTFNFNGGTLRPTANTLTFMSGLDFANVRAGGALIDTNGFNVTIPQSLLHDAALGATADGGLKKLGAGTVTLTGVSTYTGPTNASAGVLEIGSGGKLQNTFLQVPSGGTVRILPGGAYDAGTAVYINVGILAGAAPATVTQSGGTVAATATDIGTTPGSTGIYNQSGGTNTVLTQATLGLNAGTTGTYNLSGTGVFNSTVTLVGISGTAVFNQTGGTNNSAQTNVGHLPAGTGTYNLSGGQYNASSYLGVGTSGTGFLRQTGGTISTPGPLYVGYFSTGVGDYQLSAGRANTGSVNVGVDGVGTLTQTGGLLSATGQAVIANNASGVGVYHLRGGVLRVGTFVGGSGQSTLDLDGGTVQLSATTTTLFNNLDVLQILDGGAKVDTNGFNATVGSVLSHEVGDLLAQQTDGGLTKLGAGTLTLTGTNTFNGGVKVMAGTVSVQSDANLGAASGPVTIADGATLAFTSSPFSTSRTFTLSNAALTPSSGGTLTYVGATVFGGFLGYNGAGSSHNLQSGTKINYSTVLPNTSVTQLIGTSTLTGVTMSGNLSQSTGATLNYNGGYVTAAGSVTVGGTMNFSGVEVTGKVAITGTLNATGTPLVFGDGALPTISASGKLIAAASIPIELNGARLENAGDQDGILNINRDAVVTGSGTFGLVTVKAGGTFSPGNSPGSTTLDGLTFAGGGDYQFELNSTVINPGVNQDSLNVTGTLAITSTAATPFVLSITSLAPNNGAGPVSDFFTNVPYTFTLANATNITGFAANKFAFDTSDFLNPLDGGSFSVSLSGDFKKLFLTFTPVPEPATLAFLLGALPLLARRRRRSSRVGEQ